MPPEPSLLEVAAAHLALEPEKQEPELLVTAYLILLGPPVENIGGKAAAAALVEYMVVEIKGVLEHVLCGARRVPLRRIAYRPGLDTNQSSVRICPTGNRHRPRGNKERVTMEMRC
jgi:hypothetical protein